jgi:flavin reductase (DIM6/NTAB) family NADH-FMN oxidoreductase RutF
VLKDVARIHDVEVLDEPFEDLMGMLDYPVFVVTTQADGHPAGCLVSFATQTSVQPPTFVVSIPARNHTTEVASRSEHLAVHVLPRRQHALAKLFGDQTDAGVNKFDRCSWRAGPEGMPILDEALAWFVGRTVSRNLVGDHLVYLLAPVALWAPDCSDDLLYLSDVDDLGVDIPHQEPQRTSWEGVDVVRRYGLRFTLDPRGLG